jgi:predicted membrane-bound spermidine synthase
LPSFRLSVLSACLLSGAGVMIVELTTTRLLAPWFGASIYAWTNVIAVVLLALACGYAAGGRLADKNPSPRVLGTLLLAAAVLLIPATLLARFVAEALAPKPEASDPASGILGVVAGSFTASLVLFGPPLVILGAVTPFATRLLTDSGLTSGKAAGRTLAVSTIGSLIGTYLPALFLLEWVGSRGTILVAAGVLVLAAVLLLVLGGPPRKAVVPALLVLAGLGGAGALSAAAPIVPATRGETLLAEKEGAYQYVRIARWPGEGGAPAAVNLSIDEGILEFHSRKREGDRLTGAYYDFFAALPDWIQGSGEDPIDVLVIGGGAGTIRGMLRDLQGARVDHVTDVEVDPLVASFAPTFGGPPGPRDLVLVGDGRVALESLPGPFDLVILDAYARQIAIPAHLATREAFTSVRSRLSSRGVFAINVSAADVESPLVTALAATLADAFGSVWSVAVPGSWSVVLLAGSPKAPPPPDPAGAHPLDPVRRQFLRGFHALPAADRGAVLTDDRAPLESLARRLR